MGVGEFVGWRSVAGHCTDGELYAMGLTDEEIVRCRDCVFFCDGNLCSYFGCAIWDGDEWVDTSSVVGPDGYCKWGERKQAEQCEEGI